MIEEYKKIASITIPYTLLCAFLNLYFYWSNFQIQPFKYISLSEAISHAVPFLILSAFMLMPVIFLEFIRPSKHANNPGGEDDPKYIKLLISIPLTINILTILLATTSINFWPSLLFGMIAGILPGTVSLSHTKPLTENFNAASSRLFVCLVICCLPAISVMQAIIERTEATNESKLHYIVGSDLADGLEPPTKKLIYIGQLADYVFLVRENEKQIVQYRLSDLKRLELRGGDLEAYKERKGDRFIFR